MMRILLAALVYLLTAGTAEAQCAKYADMIKKLERGYKEVPVALGISNGTGSIEILVSPSGTFTIIMVSTIGVACVIANGHSFEMVPAPLEGTPT